MRNLLAKFMYRTGWIFFRAAFKTLGRVSVKGLNNLPENSGVIIAANHVSFFDPPLIGSCIRRPIFYFAKRELFSFPLFGWVLRKVNAFPVDRSSADVSAMRTAHRLIRENKSLLIFPQGGRRSQGDFRFKSGVGILSCMTGAPVVPCMVLNSDRMKDFRKIVVRFLPPVLPPAKYDRSTYETIAGEAIERIKQALTEENEH